MKVEDNLQIIGRMEAEFSPSFTKNNHLRRATILQRNYRGIRENYEVKRQMADYNPNTRKNAKESDNLSFKEYKRYNKTSSSVIDNKPTSGTSILVKWTTPHEILRLNTNLHVIVIKAN